MKTQHLYFAAFAILFASCAKQEAERSPVQSDNELRTFVADFEQTKTKTNLAQDEAGVYRKMIWSAGDKVGIFDASGVPQPFETKTGGAFATFTGSATAPLPIHGMHSTLTVQRQQRKPPIFFLPFRKSSMQRRTEFQTMLLFLWQSVRQMRLHCLSSTLADLSRLTFRWTA